MDLLKRISDLFCGFVKKSLGLFDEASFVEGSGLNNNEVEGLSELSSVTEVLGFRA